MAIAFDAATDGGFNTGTSLTYSHTVGAGTNMILFVTALGGVTDILTGATYNGVAMTLVDKQAGDGTNNAWTYLFYLLAPPAGAHNVVVTTSATATIESGAASYSGAPAAPEISAKNSATNASSLTTTLTTTTNNDWTILGAGANGTVSAGAGSTLRASSNGYGLFDSNAAITPAGSTSMTVTTAAGKSINSVMAAFPPTVASSASSSRRMLMGVG